MVGVPGKSKGCNTCRKRKIACGLQRPVCFQCNKSKRICSYHRDKVFISVNPATKTYKSGLSKTDVNTDRDLVLAASRQQLRNTSVSQCLFPTRQICSGDKPWLISLLEVPMKTRTLEASSLALSTAALGRTFKDESLVYESARLYCWGLSELQRTLSSPRLAFDDETLAACLTLSMYEMMECPAEGTHAYASHCKGLLALIQGRGPHAHVSGLGHQLFLATRLIGILYTMQQHSPTYLADPIWMKVPFSQSSKRPIDRVADCLAQAPTIFNKTDRIQELHPMEQLELANNLASQCWDLDWTMQQCYEELRLTVDGPLYWSELSRSGSPLDEADQKRLFPVAYKFPNIKIASTLMMYWATLVMLWSGLSDLYRLIDSIVNDEAATEHQELDLPPLGHRSDFLPMAWHVCRSVDYCMQEEMMTVGSLAVASPLALVIGTLRDNPHCQQEVLWMRAALGQVQGRGLRIFEHVRL